MMQAVPKDSASMVFRLDLHFRFTAWWTIGTSDGPVWHDQKFNNDDNFRPIFNLLTTAGK